MFLCVQWLGMCTCHSACVEMTAQLSGVSSLLLCVSGIKLKSSGLWTKRFYPWKHFADSTCEMFKTVLLWSIQPKWDVFIISLPSGFKDLCRRGCRGGGWLQGNSVFQTQQGWCTYKLTETVTGHTDKISAWRMGSEHKVPTQPRSCLQLIADRRGKISFLQWSDPGYINSTPGQSLTF